MDKLGDMQFPNYRSHVERLDTFTRWPWGMESQKKSDDGDSGEWLHGGLQPWWWGFRDESLKDYISLQPESMSSAGFFFTGNTDSVRCFFCGIGLRDWAAEDDPWVEHARWSPHCGYVNKMKGKDFVLLVQQAVEETERQKQQLDAHQSTQDWESTQQLGPFSGCDTPLWAKDDKDQRADRKPGKNDLETDALPFAAPDEKEESANAENPSAAELGVTHYDQDHPLQSKEAERFMDMGYLPKDILTALQRIRERKGKTTSTDPLTDLTLNANSILDELEKMDKEGHQGAVGGLEKENQELKQRWECKVCQMEMVSILFLPCGHLVCCSQCAPAMRHCPVCRAVIKGTVKTTLTP